MNYNENKLGCSEKVKESIELLSPHIYPEYEDFELNEIMYKVSEINSKNIYFSNGSDSILDSIPKIFGPLKVNSNIIIPSLTYNRIETTCSICDFEIRRVDLNDGLIDLPKMLATIDANTSIIYIVNPNMPTGKLNSHNDIIQFLEKVPSDVTVVIDEAYIEYALGVEQAYKNDLEIITKFNNVIITRTFSKFYGLASFRIGYCFSSEENIQIFKKLSQYLPVSKYSYQAAIAALKDQSYYDTVLKSSNEEKQILYSEFDKLNLKYYESSGNFIYINAKLSGFVNKDLEDSLLSNYGILIRCVKADGIRITIGTNEENKLLISGMKEFFNVKN
ncbi:MAG: pyridoxal phosphate-dependent aminotransferase, partial [Mycoplasma sp.]